MPIYQGINLRIFALKLILFLSRLCSEGLNFPPCMHIIWSVMPSHLEFWLRNGLGKHVSGKIYFALWMKTKLSFWGLSWTAPIQPAKWVGQLVLVNNSKGSCMISKIPFSLIFATFIKQNILFPETYFAYTISEPKFTVCPIDV